MEYPTRQANQSCTRSTVPLRLHVNSSQARRRSARKRRFFWTPEYLREKANVCSSFRTHAKNHARLPKPVTEIDPTTWDLASTYKNKLPSENRPQIVSSPRRSPNRERFEGNLGESSLRLAIPPFQRRRPLRGRPPSLNLTLPDSGSSSAEVLVQATGSYGLPSPEYCDRFSIFESPHQCFHLFTRTSPAL